jgi:hypothetical protein
MDPVFTLQWPEFVVAQRLQSLLPPKEGYSILVPLSRQEKGIDLVVLHRRGKDKSETTTIQVKASRTYVEQPPKRKESTRSRYNTWFNRFEVPDRADFVILVGLYAPDLGRTKRVSARWYKDCSLLFGREEMREFLAECRTRRGKPDRMFGFGFDNLSEINANRGKMKLSRRNFAPHLLEHKISALRKR